MTGKRMPRTDDPFGFVTDGYKLKKPGEVVKTLVICERHAAIVYHLRYLSDAGAKPGGGADTPTLCGVTPSWDIPAMDVSMVTCRSCKEKKEKMVKP